MTALSIINHNYSTRYQNELDGGNTLNEIGKLAVRLEVARGMQKQGEWQNIVEKGQQVEADTFFNLMDICLTDPRHKNTPAWFTEMQAQEQEVKP